jgi:pimeloyl-ACP methyl ester carboxylesterase
MFKYLISVIALLLLILLINWLGSNPTSSYQFIDQTHQFGLEKANCWFQQKQSLPDSECYFMHVPQNHQDHSQKVIKFPVVIFKSKTKTTKSPILHLGAGGPGASMYLDDDKSIDWLIQVHDDISINQGRDLIVVDPRGTGLAEPLLNCDVFIKNHRLRFQKNLTVLQEYTETDSDYKACFRNFKQQGVDFIYYNSMSFAEDMELLRKALNINKYNLIGVSYAAIYAQIMAMEHPETIESMILDSAAFPHLKEHHNFLENLLAPYKSLFNYCEIDPNCDDKDEEIETKFWALEKHLSLNPITTIIDDPFEEGSLTIVLNGYRFVYAVIEGVYDEQIFVDLPKIIEELNQGNYETLKPYLNYLAWYYLDPKYSDISFYVHYCYETKAFSDYELIRSLTNSLEDGFIKDMTLMDLNWPDYCPELGVHGKDDRLARKTETIIPTLFLQGTIDTITPSRDVNLSAQSFKNHVIKEFELSHDILSSEVCAEYVASLFVANNKISKDQLVCKR